MEQNGNSIAIVAISSHGVELARSLAVGMDEHVRLHIERRFHHPGGAEIPFDLPVRPLVQKLFSDCAQLVLFMPVGAAVRLLASSLVDKRSDPAVVTVDDAGRFAVSVLSGHLGGADVLAQEVARVLGATPVVTSGSHVMGLPALDLLGREFGWRLEAEPSEVTRASAAIVNGEAVGVYQDAGELDWWLPGTDLPVNITKYATIEELAESPSSAALIISDRCQPLLGGYAEGRPKSWESKPVVIFRPRTLALGMGCRRGVPMEELEEFLVEVFKTHSLAPGSLRCIATAELKRDEPGIISLAAKYGVPMICYSVEELNSEFGEDSPTEDPGSGANSTPVSAAVGATRRPKVSQLLGTWGVSEPAALLAAGSRELIVPRVKTSRATIAVARTTFETSHGKPKHDPSKSNQ